MIPILRSIPLRAALIVGAVLAVPCILFFIRPPVLIVTDDSFIAIYGKSHLRQQRDAAALALFRQVKPIVVAESAGSDIVSIAITEASAQPFCVLFPRSQAIAARYYHEQFPEIPVVVLRGLAQIPELQSQEGILCIYGTDRETDLYRAGLMAGILGNMKYNTAPQAEDKAESAAKTCVLWQDRFVQEVAKELFSRGVREMDAESSIIFVNNASALPDIKIISCAVLTGAGGEFLEMNPRMPVILFSWVDPDFISREVMALFDDSVWALAVPAVRMAVQQQTDGIIPSKPLVFSQKIADNSAIRALQKSAKKMPSAAYN
jgi:hypothetical protein